ncbi:hypothetical protein LCGC14_3095650 [marine sediment metagenome]|uniref:Putative exodeoxyribonuclease 8 PDDEXK-like domain-containing protein n=1 Tax=marine sediment metagenome TaxID=412755 RepID=A0A0F8W9C0_9ZZZZ
MQQEIFGGIPNEEYHRSIDYRALSSSGINKLHQKTPLHYWTNLHNPKDPTPALIFGSACHVGLLEPDNFDDLVAIVPQEVNKRTKAGKVEYAAFLAEADGKTIITTDEHEKIKEMKRILHSEPTIRALVENGIAERSGFWLEPTHGFWCKLRMDLHVESAKIILDYKTTVDADYDSFMRSIAKYGYHVQARWYVNGMKEITGDTYTYIIVAQEKEPPFDFMIHELAEDVLDQGSMIIHPVLETYAECLEKDEWPGYSHEIHGVILPPWAIH